MDKAGSEQKINYPFSTEDLYQLYLKYPSVCTDTRKIQKGDLFFCSERR